MGLMDMATKMFSGSSDPIGAEAAKMEFKMVTSVAAGLMETAVGHDPMACAAIDGVKNACDGLVKFAGDPAHTGSAIDHGVAVAARIEKDLGIG